MFYLCTTPAPTLRSKVILLTFTACSVQYLNIFRLHLKAMNHSDRKRLLKPRPDRNTKLNIEIFLNWIFSAVNNNNNKKNIIIHVKSYDHSSNIVMPTELLAKNVAYKMSTEAFV